jgi:hypothetical protein
MAPPAGGGCECGKRKEFGWQRGKKPLFLLDQRRLVDWEEAFLDDTFITAKKGLGSRQNPSRERYEVRGGG